MELSKIAPPACCSTSAVARTARTAALDPFSRIASAGDPARAKFVYAAEFGDPGPVLPSK